MPRTIHNRGIAAKIRREFDMHPGLTLYRQDLAATLEVDSSAIPSAVQYCMKTMNIETIAAGQAWRHIPNHKNSDATLFELIGRSKSGVLILQDEEGRIFKAQEID